jgi:hypothetical protein
MKSNGVIKLFGNRYDFEIIVDKYNIPHADKSPGHTCCDVHIIAKLRKSKPKLFSNIANNNFVLGLMDVWVKGNQEDSWYSSVPMPIVVEIIKRFSYCCLDTLSLQQLEEAMDEDRAAGEWCQ